MGKVKINVTKAKEISHEKRRQKREEEFKPLDEKIMKQIPGTNTADVEAQRQQIRNRYDQIQNEIDDAKDENELKTILQDRGIL